MEASVGRKSGPVASACLLLLALAAPAAATPGLIERVAGGAGEGQALAIAQGATELLVHGGVLYVGDGSFAAIRRHDLATGETVLLAGTGRGGFGGDGGPARRAILGEPSDLAVDGAGNLYFVERSHERIRRIDAATGIITTVAGGGWYAGDGERALETALSWWAISLTIDPAGNLYFIDDDRIRRVDAVTTIVTTIAGATGSGYAGDGGPAVDARFSSPTDVVLDAAGNLLVADAGNARIRRIDAVTGTIQTIAGTGVSGFAGDGGLATAAQLNKPEELSFDGGGNLFVLDRFNGRVRRIDATTGVITTIAGGGDNFFTSAWGRPATEARLDDLWTLAVGPTGDVYLGSLRGYLARVDGATGIFQKLGGNGTSHFGGDGGHATGSQLYEPQAVAVDAAGNTYISDAGNYRVRRIDAATGTIRTILGGGSRPLAPGLLGPDVYANPRGVAVGPDGQVYVASPGVILRIDPVSTVVTSFTRWAQGFGGDGGPVGEAMVDDPQAMAVDADGMLYVVDAGNARIRRVDLESGVITTVAGGDGPSYVADGMSATSGKIYADAIGFDAAGNMLLAQQLNERVRRVDRETGIVSTIVGGGGWSLTQGRLATEVDFPWPCGVAGDEAGNVYVSSSLDDTVWRVDAGTGRLRRIAGDRSDGAGGDGGIAIFAGLSAPRALHRWHDDLLVVDLGNDRIRKIGIAPGCGNGVLDGSEECDDGNGVDGDYCEANCTLPICGNGIVDAMWEECDDGAQTGSSTSCCDAGCSLVWQDLVCRPAANACDVAERCTGVSGQCPADAAREPGTACPDDGDPCTGAGVCDASAVCVRTPSPDADGDGVCDGIDACTRGEAGFLLRPTPRLIVRGSNQDGGDTRLSLSGAFALPAGWTFSDINPSTGGLRLVVRTPSGIGLDVGLPAGLRGQGVASGWKGKGGGKAWSYVTRERAPYGGIVKVTLTGPAGPSGREVSLKVTGRGGAYDFGVAGEPLTVTLAFGGHAGVVPCGEGTFGPGECQGGGTKLMCRP